LRCFILLRHRQHEFDYGDDALRECISASNFKWFGSNVRDRESGEIFHGVVDTDILTLPHGLKVGLFGVCTSATPSLSHPSDRIEFSDLVSASRRAVSELREVRGAHVVVALTHTHAAQDRDVASSVPGIDLILGGHDHEPLASDHHHTLLFKCGQNGYWVGAVDLDIDFEADATPPEETSSSSSPLLPPAVVRADSVRVFPSWHMHSTRRVEDDGGIDSIVERYQRVVDRRMLESFEGEEGGELRGLELEDAVATLRGGPLDTRTAAVRRGETNSGNLLADAMLSYFSTASSDAARNEDDAELEMLAFVNGGFIRGDKLYRKSDLSLRDVLEELPFPRDVCLLKISGEHLRQAMEQQLRACPTATAAFPHVSHNVRLVYDDSATIGSRIRSMKINGREVDGEAKYLIAVTDFVASGGDGCSAWCYGMQHAMDGQPCKLIALVLLDYLLKHRDIQIGLQSRVLASATTQQNNT